MPKDLIGAAKVAVKEPSFGPFEEYLLQQAKVAATELDTCGSDKVPVKAGKVAGMMWVLSLIEDLRADKVH